MVIVLQLVERYLFFEIIFLFFFGSIGKLLIYAYNIFGI